MSRRNGTRSRADRQWKAKYLDRIRIRELRKQLQPASPKAAAEKPKAEKPKADKPKAAAEKKKVKG